MNRPPAGLCVPCRFRHCRDADTVVVSFDGSERQWPIRLLDCWAPEKHTEPGKRAKAFVEHVMAEVSADELYVWIPPPDDPLQLLKGVLTFDRILGHLFIDSQTTLSEMVVRAGHATPKKAAGHSDGDRREDHETGGENGIA